VAHPDDDIDDVYADIRPVVRRVIRAVERGGPAYEAVVEDVLGDERISWCSGAGTGDRRARTAAAGQSTALSALRSRSGSPVLLIHHTFRQCR
jgi:hypothetical protein